MYIMKKTDTNELTEDLILTGGHSILVDELTNDQIKETVNLWGIPLKIDNKYLLLNVIVFIYIFRQKIK